MALRKAEPQPSSPVDALEQERELEKQKKIDAGLKSLDHYKSRLPRWRYVLRQYLIPAIRWETPYLARFQQMIRTPALDSYFAFTANLGTHTFFMVFLPFIFWCGYTTFGRGVVHLFASGVFFSGFLKDLFCLPRPLSPPLQRITMSGSAAMEYGFPSTHSTNAVSVALYALLVLESKTDIDPKLRLAGQVLAYWYASSIVIGRIYCGMHGFADVIVGSLLGAFLTGIQWHYENAIDSFVMSGSWHAPILIIVAIIILIRVHPEPADDCPCFDDSVAFGGVIMGLEFGHWHYASSPLSWNDPSPATVPYDFATLGWSLTFLRIVLGIASVVGWREIMKPALLRYLPPLFRILSDLGLKLPRRFFIEASDYSVIPKRLKTDNIIPSASAVISSIRHPRHRSVSVGPQSAADAYETINYRQRIRSESVSSQTDGSSPSQKTKVPENGSPLKNMAAESEGKTSNGSVPLTSEPADITHDETLVSEQEKREIFSKVQKTRVRYDVEVVTKIIVYFGIGWIAAEGGGLLFEVLRLGVNAHR